MASEKTDAKEEKASDRSKEKKEETTTVHVSEERQRKFPGRTLLIYILLLAAGLFIGIVFRLATR